VVNHWGGHDRDSIVKLVQQKLVRPLTLWNDVAPQLTFAEWQRVMEMDRHSVQTDSVDAVISPELVLKWKPGASPHQLPPLLTARWDGLDRDFLGELIPIAGARVGPFQSLTDGSHETVLWP
jgi:hypothetical protein